MESLIAKAKVLMEALPYIQDFRNAVVVVKFGGSAMERPEQTESILKDITLMECVGMLPVIVHGGGKAISRGMQAAGLTPKFVHGLRVTDEAAMKVAAEVMKTQINPAIIATLAAQGAQARRVDGEQIFSVIKRTGIDQTTGQALDWGYVGEVTGVDPFLVQACFHANLIPVITPIGRGPEGGLYNLNADDAAAALAKALQARKLAFLSDVPGLLRDRNDETTVMSTLRIREVEELIRTGVIDGGMLPKIRGCVEALAAGVKKIHIIDGRAPHSLLLEIFTDKGVGTEIIQ